MWIGQPPFSNSRSRSSTAAPWYPTGQAMGSAGTRKPWSGIDSAFATRMANGATLLFAIRLPLFASPSNRRPSRRRFLAGMNGAALLARAGCLVLVKGFVKRRQILHQMLDLHLDAVDEGPAFEAVPLESVELVRARGLDHQTDRVPRPLRR